MSTAKFEKQKHITYWLRCLKVFLPGAYRSLDANRMMITYFCLSALELLDSLFSKTTEQERADYIDWIYNCQHPNGGFRSSPLTNLGRHFTEENAAWDPASVPSTCFALCSLIILRDNLSRFKKRACLAWLRKMQRSDGSFGQTLGDEGQIEGGYDTRFGYTAIGICWLLGELDEAKDHVEGADSEALTRKIATLQTFDGGISEAPFLEAHGGYTFCAMAALSFLGRIKEIDGDSLVRWLALRSTIVFDPPEDDEDDSEPEQHPVPGKRGETQEIIPLDLQSDCLGFNGRPNKTADTCYAWWICATLQLLGKLDLVDSVKAQQYLLEMTQHRIGGFSKYPDDPPDIYHAYFGLAALSLLSNEHLKPIHPAACISMDSIDYIHKLSKNLE